MAKKDKWWGPLVSTEIRILFLIEFAVVLIGAIVAGGLIWCSKGFATLSDGFEFFRALVAAMIAVGGAYGLILASRRSAKFSEQVDTGQKQLFNEQLGRGAELLTRKEMVMRRTGIRVLEDLAETTINKPEQVELIMRIIHDFVHEKTSSSSEDEERLDIALGIRTLASLYNEVDKSDGPVGFIKLLNFSWCHLEKLDFKNAELQGVNFMGAKLEGANFDSAELQGVNFGGAELQGADFRGAKLERARFYRAQLQGANFDSAKLEGASFIGAELQWADFDSAELQEATFRSAKLQGANFRSAKLEWVDCTGADFLGAENLKKEQVGVMIFDTKFFPKLPKGVKDDLDPKFGYEWKEDSGDKSNRRYFVQPDVNAKESEKWEWSGKSVDEHLASIRNPKDDG